MTRELLHEIIHGKIYKDNENFADLTFGKNSYIILLYLKARSDVL